MNSKLLKIMLLLFFVFSLFYKLPYVEASESNKVILIVVDYLKLQDLQSSPVLKKLCEKRGVGLLNSNTGASRTIPHTYATVNAGGLVSAPRTGIQIYNAKEKVDNITAIDLYKSKTGYSVPEEAVLVLSLPQLLKQNEINNSDKEIGKLGTQLASAGYTTAILGNADLPNLQDRSVALIGMNSLGYVPLGDVSKNLNISSNDFLGLRTDYVKLLDSFIYFYSRADFIIINLGDLVRLEVRQTEALSDRVISERQEILNKIGTFILNLQNIVDINKDLILMGALSQNPKNATGENRMLPFTIYSKQINQGSILASSTTKRPGIITNVDVTATILNHFNLPYNLTMGRPFSISFQKYNPLKFLSYLNRRISFVYDARTPLVKTYVLSQIIVVLAAIPILLFLPDLAPIMKQILLILTSYPLSLLLLGAFNTDYMVLYTFISLAITASIVYLSNKITKNWLISFMFIGFLTAFTILVDLATGTKLAQFSPLSYQAITGARYYGIGNEYMGVLIGSIMVSCSIAYHLYQNLLTKIIITISLIVTTLFIALPQLGINFGGTIAAICTFSFALLAWENKRFSADKIFKLGTLIFACIAIIIMYDLTRNIESQSHLARTAFLIKEQGFSELWLIITRKIAMNIKLIKYTSWSRVFLATLVASAFLLFRPVSIFNTFKQQFPKIFSGFLATIVGSIVALIFNDSGIVASATMMIYSAAPLIYLAFNYRLGKTNNHKILN